jgi:hypothetical protein
MENSFKMFYSTCTSHRINTQFFDYTQTDMLMLTRGIEKELLQKSSGTLLAAMATVRNELTEAITNKQQKKSFFLEVQGQFKCIR